MKRNKYIIFTALTVFLIIFNFTFGASPEDYNYSENIEANAPEDINVIPMGISIGIKIDVKGVMVLGFSDIRTTDGKKVCPAKECGLKNGDVITKANGKEIKTVDDLSEIISKTKEKAVPIEFLHNDEVKNTDITPVFSNEDSSYKLGMWVRDTTSGVGTLTYIVPKTGAFGALGHPVTDIDTKEIISIGEGRIFSSNVINVIKSEKGSPGELQGVISDEHPKGIIEKNTEFGIFGKMTEDYNEENTVPVASRDEISEGKAKILANITGKKIEEFEVEIVKIYKGSYNNKSMVIKVTDEKLLAKTGGIVQGMSGCPILQQGKLVGAVTHVFINDPTRGYGIFAELMTAMN